MQRSPAGLFIIAAGVLLIVVGALVWSGALSWFGRLPGDIRIERPGVRIYVPLVTMLIVSVVLSLFVALWRHWR